MTRIKQCQKNLDVAVKNLPNFQNIESVLDWCNVIFENHIVGTKLDRTPLLEEFKANALVPHMNTGIYYDGENKENSGRYIVGQFLDNFQRGDGGIPGIFHSFYHQWKQKFC